MTDKPLHILSTGLLDEELVKSVEGQIRLDCIPFVEPRSVAPEVIAQAVAALVPAPRSIIFTSKNAVMAVAAAQLVEPHWDIFCIEPATKKRVQASFPASIIVASAPNGAQLAKQIVAHAPKEVLFFCGNQRLNTIPRVLKAHAILCKEIIAYHTIETPAFISDSYNAILFYSPSGVKSFFSVNTLPEQTIACSIGPSTTEALKKYTDKVVESTLPDFKQLLQLAVNLNQL